MKLPEVSFGDVKRSCSVLNGNASSLYKMELCMSGTAFKLLITLTLLCLTSTFLILYFVSSQVFSSVSAFPSIFIFSSFCLSSFRSFLYLCLSRLRNFPFVPLSVYHSFIPFLGPTDNYPSYFTLCPFYFVYFFLLHDLFFLYFFPSFFVFF